MRTSFETERITLRRLTLDDVDDVLALDLDPLVRRYVEDGKPVTPEATAAMIAGWIADDGDDDVLGFWAATERRSGRFLGWFHLVAEVGRAEDDAELGYRLIADAWGQGYATEGSRALVDRGFASGRLQRVHALAMAVHTASWRVMEKCGMRHVRTFPTEWPVHIPGDEHGDVEYEITLADWTASRPRG